jgi:hypothetical protein
MDAAQVEAIFRREYGCISIRSQRAVASSPHPPSWVAVGTICFRGWSGGDDRRLLGQRPMPLSYNFESDAVLFPIEITRCRRNSVMRKVIVIEFITLDGVIQAGGGP